MCVILLSEHILTQTDVKIQPVVTTNNYLSESSSLIEVYYDGRSLQHLQFPLRHL